MRSSLRLAFRASLLSTSHPLPTLLSSSPSNMTCSRPTHSCSSPLPSSHPAQSINQAGYDFYRARLMSPRFIVAPMVDASELAWRILSRYYGAELCYTPMIHAALFAEPRNAKYRQEQFDLESGEEGAPGLDRPLLAQFCANDPETLLAASELIARPDGSEMLDKVDGFDLNLGCPQGIAKKGKYGAFLMDHLELVSEIVSHLHKTSPLPVTAKYRCFESAEKTNAYTERLIQAGAQVLTIHGRTREQKGQFTGLADWNLIQSAVKTSHEHGIPIFGNGNILVSSDALALLRETNADGVMTAEGNLYNPAIFASLNPSFIKSYRDNLPQKFKDGFRLVDEDYHDPQGHLGSAESLVNYPNCTKVASQYLMICRTLDTRTATSAIKGHLYKLFRSVFDTGRYNDIRDVLAQISWSSKPSPDGPLSVASESLSLKKRKDKASYHLILDRFQEVVSLVRARLESDRTAGLLNEADIDTTIKKGDDEPTTEYLDRLRIPYSRCQPYVRPLQIHPSRLQHPVEATSAVSGASLDPCKPGVSSNGPPLGPPPCGNPSGCVNSGAAKCRWLLCKTCCAQKTASDEGGGECEVHAARAKLEMEKRAYKAEKRKLRAVAQAARKVKQPRLDQPTAQIVSGSQ